MILGFQSINPKVLSPSSSFFLSLAVSTESTREKNLQSTVKKMGFKRKKGDGEGEEMESEVSGRPSFNTAERRNVILPSMIKNKDKRAKVYAKQKHEKKVEKQKKIKARDAAEKQALELGEEVNELSILRLLFDFGNLKRRRFVFSFSASAEDGAEDD